MVFDGHPCVSWYISENPKQANEQVYKNRGQGMWKSTISVYKSCNIKTESLSIPSDPATAYFFMITTYKIAVG